MKFNGSSALVFALGLLVFFSCTKINESTTLGGDLIPAVDNVNTFDTTLEVSAAYYPYIDSSRHGLYDNFAIGRLNDPEFGTTTADAYFNFSSPVAYGTNPFTHKDSVKAIDSVVLSLGYQGAYGDTSISQLTVEVSEILPSSNFRDNYNYRYDTTGFTTGITTGPVLGRRQFTVRQIKDSVRVERKGDTVKVANTLRIKFDNNQLADRLRRFDTALTGANPGYASDSAFRALFRGLAVKTTDASGVGVLGYFNLADPNSRLIVYYKAGKSTGVDSGASVSFTALRSAAAQNGHANIITRAPGASNYATNLAKNNSQQLYLQSAPSGSYIGISVPLLTGFPNKVVHRAELIAYALPSASETMLKKPNTLFLAHKGPSDSLYVFERDLVPNFDNSLNFSAFGGFVGSDNAYRFNITRYVQGIITRGERNDSLILYAPYVARVYAGRTFQPIGNLLAGIAAGRVVIANNNFADPNRRLRLRIIYSNL